jgi:hypothetical protein
MLKILLKKSYTFTRKTIILTEEREKYTESQRVREGVRRRRRDYRMMIRQKV